MASEVLLFKYIYIYDNRQTIKDPELPRQFTYETIHGFDSEESFCALSCWEEELQKSNVDKTMP